ncbi:MAG TPA: enoyl-CoA hydratase-related protein, partial [Flavobacteriales bacterium]|nr:enoyl-CoA hydratase-related protein [Flavobacteriales bacterium]
MDSIIFKQDGNVAVLTLNRPAVFNSFNREMALLLQQRLDECANDKSIRALLLTGEGKAFCAGQDLQEAMGGGDISIEKIVNEHYNPIIKRIRSIEKPIVCAVNGVAAGAGANIALACDVVVAGSGVSFIQAFSKIGLIPDSGGTFFLPRLIGYGKASALMMLGEKVSAYDAEKMGMIYKVVDDAGLMNTSMQLAETLAGMPTVGLGLTKRLMNESFTNDLAKQLEAEMHLQAKAAKTYDYNEGVKAFLEKRKPVFKG